MERTEPPSGIDLRRMAPILLIIFTNILGAGAILPILPLYAEGQFSGTIFQITLLSASFFGAQFLAAPVLGRLSDQHGRRPVLILSQIGTVAAFVLFILAAPLGSLIDSLTSSISLPLTGGMIMLFLARTLDGITGGNITTAQAFVSDITSTEDRAQGLGYLQGAFGAGFIFGPAFGGFLSTYGPVVPFVGAVIITTGTLALTTFMLKESHPESERGSQSERQGLIPSPAVLQRQPTLTLILAITFVSALAFSSLPATFALFADRVIFPASTRSGGAELYVGLLLTFHGVMTVITQVALLRPLITRLRERRLLVVGQAALVLAFLGLGFASSPLIALAAFMPFAFGQGVSQPSLQSLVTRFGDRHLGGQLLGFYQSARSLALIFGPIWAGYVFEAVSARATYWTGAGVAGAALLLGLVLLGRQLPVHAEHDVGRQAAQARRSMADP